MEISKMVLDPSCDEALLLLNEIINFTVFTVQIFFSLSSSYMYSYVLYLDLLFWIKYALKKKEKSSRWFKINLKMH